MLLLKAEPPTDSAHQHLSSPTEGSIPFPLTELQIEICTYSLFRYRYTEKQYLSVPGMIYDLCFPMCLPVLTHLYALHNLGCPVCLSCPVLSCAMLVYINEHYLSPTRPKEAIPETPKWTIILGSVLKKGTVVVLLGYCHHVSTTSHNAAWGLGGGWPTWWGEN